MPCATATPGTALRPCALGLARESQPCLSGSNETAPKAQARKSSNENTCPAAHRVVLVRLGECRELAQLARTDGHGCLDGAETARYVERHGKRALEGEAARGGEFDSDRLGRPRLHHPAERCDE